MSEKTLQQMTDEIREVNVAKGWRPAEGGPGTNTWGDYIALLHSEVSEALEAYRDHRLEDATAPPEILRWEDRGNGPEAVLRQSKPEGVGSEFADILIRLLDMADVFGFKPYEMDMALGDVADLETAIPRLDSFGAWLAWLHAVISEFGLWANQTIRMRDAAFVLRALVTTARNHGIDLEFEYERKLEFNRTRAFRHGGRAL